MKSEFELKSGIVPKAALIAAFLVYPLLMGIQSSIGHTLLSGAGGVQEPAGLFLTWQQDPTTTMTVDWHTRPHHEAEPVLRYKAVGSNDWKEAVAVSHEFVHSDYYSESDFTMIHRVELTGLTPGSDYRFRAGEFERLYQFRTMPDDISEPLRFAAGGDTRISMSTFGKMNRSVMEHDPDFIIWGGDIAYADGRADRVNRWHEWFDTVLKTLVTDDGRVIPLVLAIGNHEMLRAPDGNEELGGNYYYLFQEEHTYEQTDAWRATYAPYFFNLFAFPGQPGYGVLNFGDYLTLLALDSSHANPVYGEQTEWLTRVLSERKHAAHIIPFYHVPVWPSVREGGLPADNMKEHWIPLFEEYGVRLVFENHDHAYKRTYPVLGDEIHPDGIVYLGDGAWGVPPREVHPPGEKWYLRTAETINNGQIVTLHGNDLHVLVIDENGNRIDEIAIQNGELQELVPVMPEEVTLAYPLSMNVVPVRPEFSWNKALHATEYQFQLTESNFASSTILLMDTTIAYTHFEYPDDLEPDMNFRWRVRAHNDSGAGPWSDTPLIYSSSMSVNVESVGQIPNTFQLDHNYPNPFNPVTHIRYGLPESSHVDLRVFDLIGREVAVLINQYKNAGYHSVRFNSGNLPSGTYIVRFTAAPDGKPMEGITRKMTLIK